MQDMSRKGRANPVKAAIPWQHATPERVPRGENHHLRKDSSCLPRGSAHHGSKLTEEDVLLIRASSEKSVRLSEKFGITEAAICSIRKGRTWRHLLAA
jgi:hypothetical protein